jgi:hypothetical protein
MEITSKENELSGSKKMGEPILSKYTAQGYIDYCTETLNITPTMLAGLLNVTERTLGNWKDKPILEDENQDKMDRLKTIYKIISIAIKKGIKGRVILNFLNEPIPLDKEERSLLYYVVDDPNSTLVETVALQVIDSFK